MKDKVKKGASGQNQSGPAVYCTQSGARKKNIPLCKKMDDLRIFEDTGNRKHPKRKSNQYIYNVVNP
jgi:hypothetical protein